MIDEKMEPSAAKEILKGNADALNSSFHLGYNMLLNLLRVEGADPEHIMSLSFFQYQSEQTAPALEAAMADRQVAKDAIVIADEVQVAQYHALNLQLAKCKQDMKDIINTPKYIVPFLQPGRLVRVKVCIGGPPAVLPRIRSIVGCAFDRRTRLTTGVGVLC
jgi:ATP-dependent RNA helicase DOB1